MADPPQVLDRPDSYGALDPEDMYRRVRDLVHQVEDAWRISRELELPDDMRHVRNVVIAGMGGSAIGGSLLQSYGVGTIPVPVEVWRNYGLPAYVDEHSLVIGMSYSGGTEETLSALQSARNRGARMVVISTGGKVLELARTWGIPTVTFQYQAQPRATLGYLFTPLIRVFELLGFLAPQESEIQESLMVLRQVAAEWDGTVPTKSNRAKQLAVECHGRAVVVYGADYLAAVARRWKTQMNENAKQWSFYEEFPELNHNAIVGYEYPHDFLQHVQVAVLNGSELPARIDVRRQVTERLMVEYQVPHLRVDAVGKGRLAQIFSLIALGDYVTYYLALLNGADPTTIAPINTLKAALAEATS